MSGFYIAVHRSTAMENSDREGFILSVVIVREGKTFYTESEDVKGRTDTLYEGPLLLEAMHAFNAAVTVIESNARMLAESEAVNNGK